MNVDRALQRLGQQAAALVGSRSPEVARAARRARALIGTVRHACRHDLDVELVVRDALAAATILDALEQRDRRRADRRRARHLATAAPATRCKVTDAALVDALAATGGSIRAAARRLGVAPSTISRRAPLLPPVTARNTSAGTVKTAGR